MISEAECEENFEEYNTVDKTHMEPLDSDMWDSAMDRRRARGNANEIKNNIQKLVRVFRRPELFDKLKKMCRQSFNRPQSEIIQFNAQFEKLTKLWQTRLSTSLEEHTRM